MPKSFYIIDGHAHIYRAYFAPFRDLTSPSGEPTKATFVFTQMLLNLLDQRKPDYLAMVIDAGDETVFRKEIFPEYKANRQARPDDFGPQEQRILQIVRDAGIPIFVKSGFEADDLIATMAKRLCGQDFETFLVSKDKDLRQIINDCTKMYDVQGDEVIDEVKMLEKCGYGPRQAIEIQTLMGDTIDNVPGIPGVGEKTAAKLIQKYGTADEVLNHLDELTPKMRENFEKFADRLPISRKLVTLKDDVEFEFDAEACRFKGVRTEALKTHFQTLGFYNLLKRINGSSYGSTATVAPPKVKYEPFSEGLFGQVDSAAPPPGGEIAAPSQPGGPSTCADCKYELIDTEEKFASFLAELRRQKRFAFDTETDALGAMNSNLIGLSFSWQHKTGYYVPVKGPVGCAHLECERVLRDLAPIISDPNIKKVGHNIKYDQLVMRRAGLNLQGIEMDTMIGSFIIDADRLSYGIDQLALDLLNFRKIATAEIIGSGRNQISMDRVSLERVATYASEDADIALRLADLIEDKLKDLPQLRKLCDEVETPLIDVLAEMEFNGVAIDPTILKEQSEVLAGRIEELRKKIHTEAGCEFNLDSPKQLGDVLFNRLKLKVTKKTPGVVPSTDTEVLDKLAGEHPVPKLIQAYRELVKLKNTYLDNLTAYLNPTTGRVHGSFNQTGAATGRLSMSDPSLQNIPIRTDEGRRIRLAFVPGDREHNVLLTADYSQIELRVLAHFTQEPALVRAFEADEDIHRIVAAEVFSVAPEQVTRDQRGQAKTINFGIIYGVSAYGLARRIEGLTVQSAGELIAAYNKRFPSIHHFLLKCVHEAQNKGFVETILGRRRPIPEINSSIVNMRNQAERMAINSVVQGSAADLIKVAMVNIHRRLKRENHPSKMLLQVHDELVFETPQDVVEKEAEMVREEMTGAMKLLVPIKVEVGWAKNWQEVK